MKRTLVAAVLITSVAAIGCTKTVTLKEDDPVQISAAPPAPEPEPEPEPPKRVEVKEERIEVNETIEFEFNKAVIRPESDDLMSEIASVINEHPEIKKIRLEGHTDNIGSKKFNMKLSLRRARAVREWLVNRGEVDASRLEVAGYGFDRPIATNDTEEGRAQNRRVAFEILERDPDAAGGEPEGGDDEAPEGGGDDAASTEGGGDDAGTDGDDAGSDEGGE